MLFSLLILILKEDSLKHPLCILVIYYLIPTLWIEIPLIAKLHFEGQNKLVEYLDANENGIYLLLYIWLDQA